MTMDEAGSEGTIELRAPLAGWVLPLAEVPDAVFAGGMAGDGLAIDPVQGLLQAPCAGRVQLLPNARHALTLCTAVGDVLMHVGIDTVNLKGRGFELLVRDGEQVQAMQALLRFDLASVASTAPSLVTPLVVSGARIVSRRESLRVEAGEPLMTLAATRVTGATGAASSTGAASAGSAQAVHRTTWRVTFEHGLHARPAARLAACLESLEVVAVAHAHERRANVRSAVALMALGLRQGEVVTIELSGRDAHEALRRLAALLERAEPVASPEVLTVRTNALTPAMPPPAGSRLRAHVAVAGIGIGVAVRVVPEAAPVVESSGDAGAEIQRLRAAIGDVSAHLAQLATRHKPAQAELLAAHATLLADPELQREAEALVMRGASAGAAWREVLQAAGRQLAALPDERLAERRADLSDIEMQVLRVLAGLPADGVPELPAGAVVLARELLPSQFLALDRSHIAGLCMSEGGATSHVAILAAAAGIPMLVAAGPAVHGIADGTALLLDADAGVLLVEPAAAEREAYAAQRARAQAALSQALVVAAQPAVTRDAVTVHVYCNLGGQGEVAEALRQGAEGCGLLRTEFMFQERATPPDAAEQLAGYQAIAAALEDRVLTIRTLDAGGDKPIAWLPAPAEQNPALGLRGIRAGLRHPELLAAQLRAIVAVRPAGRARVLLPMITDAGEVQRVRSMLEAEARALGVAPPALGVMIETPASAMLADQLAEVVDFFSIGSNDLTQYTLAMDRQHSELGAQLDALHPAVLRLIRRVCVAGAERRIEVAVCGGVASDPEAMPVLLGLGVRELSAAPAGIALLKARIRGLSMTECELLAEAALALPDAAAVRKRLRAREL